MKEPGLFLHFGTFLATVFVSFYHLYSTFSDGPRTAGWWLAGVRTDRSFQLIFKRYSLNIFLEPSQLFQFVLPSVGASTCFAIALREFLSAARGSKFSHLTFQLSREDLMRVKATTEFFFDAKEGLESLGFANFRPVNGKYTCSLSTSHSGLIVTAEFQRPRLLFSVIGEGEHAKAIEAFLNFSWESVANQLIALRLATRLIDSDGAFATAVMTFAWRVITVADRIGVDLPQALVAWTAAAGKNSMTFALVFGAQCTRIEFLHRPGGGMPSVLIWDGAGEVGRATSFEALQRWFENLVI
jgi:hypothetical protein